MKTVSAGTRHDLSSRLLNWTGTIIHSKAFWSILILKICAAWFFGSSYLTGLFIPFLETFVSAPHRSVYDVFWSSGQAASFPYPAAMLYIMALPRWLLLQLGVSWAAENFLLFIYRIPILLADIAIFLVLSRWLRQKVKLILWLYWASPVLFYINYLHGQLDAIPMALAFLSIYLMFSGRLSASAVLLSLAIAAKMHMLLILPFALLYLWQDNLRMAQVLRFLAIVVCVFLIVNLPFIFSNGFIHMVFLNAPQNKIGMAAVSTGSSDVVFYLIPALLMTLVTYSFHIQIRNRDLFLIFIGVSFGIILLFIPPVQGWYYWVLPFFIYFYARISYPYLLLLLALQACYFLYFWLIPDSDFTALLHTASIEPGSPAYSMLALWGVPVNVAVNIAFTGLQTVLFLSCAVMYYRGIYLPQRNKLTSRPFMLAVAGDSGAGKSTISSGMLSLLGARQASVICGDDMHKWQRGHERWSELTHLDPRANELHTELEYLKTLRQNRLIWRRHYDHNTGKFTDELPINPRPVMVLEGLHSFYLKPARDLFDLKIFVKPEPSLLLHRKVVRDIKKRNYTKEKVISSIESRRKDSEKYIVTQERYADIIISFMLREEISFEEIGNPDLVINEWLRVTISNEYFMDPIVTDFLSLLPDGVKHYYDENDLQVLDFDVPPTRDDIIFLGEKYVSGLQHFGIYDPDWHEGWQGVIQLLIGYCVFHGWEMENGS
jgi:uridine kinase